MAESTKTASFLRATSTPSTRAATSLSWMARNARPLGLSIRLSASVAPMRKLAAVIQYQVSGPRRDQPNNTRRGTDMPSGPPVKPASLLNTMASSSPKPSVATAR